MEAIDTELKQDDFRGIADNVKVRDLRDEAFDAFSDAPYDFENTAQMLWEDTQKVYYHACTANRFTDKYLRLCSQLEKNIKELGSWCITKAGSGTKGHGISEAG